MSRYSLGAYARFACRMTCTCTTLLAVLTCCSGLMIRWGDAPLQYASLTKQMLPQIPGTFLCGMLAVLLCDILDKKHRARE